MTGIQRASATDEELGAALAGSFLDDSGRTARLARLERRRSMPRRAWERLTNEYDGRTSAALPGTIGRRSSRGL